MNNSEDRRHFWRVPFHATAELADAGGAAHAGRVHDLSLKGALFEAAEAWQGKGTGLGLSIVKHALMIHHATVHVDSIPGKGTIFTVRIPRRPM